VTADRTYVSSSLVSFVSSLLSSMPLWVPIRLLTFIRVCATDLSSSNCRSIVLALSCSESKSLVDRARAGEVGAEGDRPECMGDRGCDGSGSGAGGKLPWD
jgi:hypothetical protein